MGSLKDEMRGLRDDSHTCEKTDDGEHPGRSAHEDPQISTSQESTTEEDYQPKLQMNTSFVEETAGDPASKDSTFLSGVCGNIDNPDSMTEKDCTQTNIASLTQQHEANKTSTVMQNDMTISTQSTSHMPQTDLSPHGGVEIHLEMSVDRNVDQNLETVAESKNVTVAVPSTPEPFSPCSPAPFGQCHVHTQVSLEVIQCHSAATSPMTPPGGGRSFFFPNSFGRSGAVGSETKCADLQLDRQVEFCSVATSPMTPKTPYSTAFPETVGITAQMGEKIMKSMEQGHVQQESFPVTKSPAEAESALKFTSPQDPTEGSNASPEQSSCPDPGLVNAQEERNQQCKQQRMGSMDQDITILVTHHDNTEAAEEEERGESTESTKSPIEPEMVKIDEYDELSAEKTNEVERDGGKEETTKTIRKSVDPETPNINHQQSQIKTEEPSNKQPQTEEYPTKYQNLEAEENKATSFSDKLKDNSQSEHSLTKTVPESPAPFGCHNIRTQVSLEVVQCQSAATSPMTPPEGDQAFYFPSTLGRPGAVGTETKDAQLQDSCQVQYRSVATAPMTPRTPTVTAFPEIQKEKSTNEETVKDGETEVTKERAEEEKLIKEQSSEAAEEKKEEVNCKERGEEKSEEPVQEVSWDEKGMTWEVYGAVVEVAVLGSAIQKHLEKQVKKQKREQPTPPPAPNPSATAVASDSTHGGSVKGRAGKRGERDGKANRRRRNPFRFLLQNMQQPHCCSRAHTSE
ncbi:hypothetical protein LDENG_00178900 [Lucifuga dentata]|nr:hypothetical protein LDENG_00178900 [Lucifuga dentata]